AALLSIGLLVAPAPKPRATTSDLTPAARIHHQRGLTALDAREFEASIGELERAYALLPDPLRHRDGRSKVLGSLRAALLEAHAATGDRARLERLQALLLAHGEALRVALGPSGTPEDFAMIEVALQQVETQLRREAPVPPAAAPVASPAVSQQAARPPSLSESSRSSAVGRERGLRIAGGVLMGVGTAALGVMAYGVVVHIDDRHKLQSLTAFVAASGARPTHAQDQEALRYLEGSDQHRTLAAVMGVLGGVALITGVGLHVAGGKRAQNRLAPALGPRFAGVTWRLVF
ncbi:MAG: hypothetical protein H0T76_20945, partial [Nannocystis sp.]